jgi:hypothetical protein
MWMRRSFKRRKTDFKRRILARVFTNRTDLLVEEQRWLSMIKDEELKVRYYNVTSNVRNFHSWWVNEDGTYKTTKEKIKKGLEGLEWYTDGAKDYWFRDGDVIPVGVAKGRTGWDEQRKAEWSVKNHRRGKTGPASHLFGVSRTGIASERQSASMRARYATGEISPHNKGTADRRQKRCLGCQQEFLTPPRKPHQLWCSKKCYEDSRSTQSTVILCATCGSERRVHLSQIKRGSGKFCSQSCRTKLHMTPERGEAMAKSRWGAPRPPPTAGQGRLEL